MEKKTTKSHFADKKLKGVEYLFEDKQVIKVFRSVAQLVVINNPNPNPLVDRIIGNFPQSFEAATGIHLI